MGGRPSHLGTLDDGGRIGPRAGQVAVLHRAQAEVGQVVVADRDDGGLELHAMLQHVVVQLLADDVMREQHHDGTDEGVGGRGVEAPQEEMLGDQVVVGVVGQLAAAHVDG